MDETVKTEIRELALGYNLKYKINPHLMWDYPYARIPSIAAKGLGTQFCGIHRRVGQGSRTDSKEGRRRGSALGGLLSCLQLRPPCSLKRRDLPAAADMVGRRQRRSRRQLRSQVDGRRAN